ncbi:hypothetical protein THASP1DRAFT_28297 [Thamnocephalis sphaerospora]|uniref:Queuosine 5'-phosphate N-glycosylase/hydrolase n=1 Tax=Thamnocephalis sphaerospora TaxID=78915 RepID=A0A4P9XUL7_9FUNG|nr:hypothetical protein THASP1DRAFT_28297 [Thamnocephalis sphaerospora]|eukprot:RKP09934.1 hypothetical protein THASP1DRAFT_28297 [Thamnocephalis sphaerospora]
MKSLPCNPVLESAQFVHQHSKDVAIDEAAVERTAHELLRALEEKPYSTADWKRHPLNPNTADDAAIDWIFLVDTLNFSFWSDAGEASPDRFAVVLDGQRYTGYWSLCACINRALAEGIPVTSAAYYAHATDDELRRIFRSDARESVPMLDERLAVMRQTGRILLETFGGSFSQCIRQCQGSALRLLALITKQFPCYRDEGAFMGRTVQYFKRAQILIADIWACFEGQGLGEFHDIDQITMFADYRVPQALVYLNILSYSSDLWALLQRQQPLASGDRLEQEIRAVSIWAVELLRRRMVALRGHNTATPAINAILLDFYLWDYAKTHTDALRSVPIHRTRSIFY